MKHVTALFLLALAAPAFAGEFCTFAGEQRSGMNKICYYHCASGTKAITIASYEMCPMSLDKSPAVRELLASMKPHAPKAKRT